MKKLILFALFISFTSFSQRKYIQVKETKLIRGANGKIYRKTITKKVPIENKQERPVVVVSRKPHTNNYSRSYRKKKKQGNIVVVNSREYDNHLTERYHSNSLNEFSKKVIVSEALERRGATFYQYTYDMPGKYTGLFGYVIHKLKR